MKIDTQTLMIAAVFIIVAAGAFAITRSLSNDVIVNGVKVQQNAPLNQTFATLLASRHIVVQQDVVPATDPRNTDLTNKTIGYNGATGTMLVSLNYALALTGKNVTSVAAYENGTTVGCKMVTVNGVEQVEERCRDPVIRVTIGNYNGLRVMPNQLLIEGTPVFFTDPVIRAQIADLIANGAPKN